MVPEERDLAYLWDMRAAAKDVVEFIYGKTYEQFCSDKMLRFAVERRIEAIGEAANHVSLVFRQAHPEIPWGSIIGQRNVLAHEYGEVLLERIWLVVIDKLPGLIENLNLIIPPIEE